MGFDNDATDCYAKISRFTNCLNESTLKFPSRKVSFHSSVANTDNHEHILAIKLLFKALTSVVAEMSLLNFNTGRTFINGFLTEMQFTELKVLEVDFMKYDPVFVPNCDHAKGFLVNLVAVAKSLIEMKLINTQNVKNFIGLLTALSNIQNFRNVKKLTLKGNLFNGYINILRESGLHLSYLALHVLPESEYNDEILKQWLDTQSSSLSTLYLDAPEKSLERRHIKLPTMRKVIHLQISGKVQISGPTFSQICYKTQFPNLKQIKFNIRSASLNKNASLTRAYQKYQLFFCPTSKVAESVQALELHDLPSDCSVISSVCRLFPNLRKLKVPLAAEIMTNIAAQNWNKLRNLSLLPRGLASIGFLDADTALTGYTSYEITNYLANGQNVPSQTRNVDVLRLLQSKNHSASQFCLLNYDKLIEH